MANKSTNGNLFLVYSAIYSHHANRLFQKGNRLCKTMQIHFSCSYLLLFEAAIVNWSTFKQEAKIMKTLCVCVSRFSVSYRLCRIINFLHKHASCSDFFVFWVKMCCFCLFFLPKSAFLVIWVKKNVPLQKHWIT